MDNRRRQLQAHHSLGRIFVARSDRVLLLPIKVRSALQLPPQLRAHLAAPRLTNLYLDKVFSDRLALLLFLGVVINNNSPGQFSGETRAAVASKPTVSRDLLVAVLVLLLNLGSERLLPSPNLQASFKIQNPNEILNPYF